MKIGFLIAVVIALSGMIIQIFDMDKYPLNFRGLITSMCGLLFLIILTIIKTFYC